MIERTEKIRNLPVSFDVLSACIRLDINTLEELIDYPKDKILKDRRVSNKTYHKIINYLNKIKE